MKLNMKEKNVKIASSQNWKVITLAPLENLLNEQQDRLLPRHMDMKTVLDGTLKKYESQAGYMSLPSLKEHKFFRTSGKIHEHSIFG